MQRALIVLSASFAGGLAVWSWLVASPPPERGPGWSPRPARQVRIARADLGGRSTGFEGEGLNGHDSASQSVATVPQVLEGDAGPTGRDRIRERQRKDAERHLAELWRALAQADGDAEARALQSLRALKELAAAPENRSLQGLLIAQMGRVLASRAPGRRLTPEAYREAAAVLGELGSRGTDALMGLFMGWLNAPASARSDTSAATLLRQIGRTRDPEQVKFLLQVAVQGPRDELRVAAGLALGYYEIADGRTRWEIARRLVSSLVQIHWRATNGMDPTAQGTLSAVEMPWRATLARICGVEHRTPPAWGRWWNRTGKDREGAVWQTQ